MHLAHPVWIQRRTPSFSAEALAHGAPKPHSTWQFGREVSSRPWLLECLSRTQVERRPGQNPQSTSVQSSLTARSTSWLDRTAPSSVCCRTRYGTHRRFNERETASAGCFDERKAASPDYFDYPDSFINGCFRITPTILVAAPLPSAWSSCGIVACTPPFMFRLERIPSLTLAGSTAQPIVGFVHITDVAHLCSVIT